LDAYLAPTLVDNREASKIPGGTQDAAGHQVVEATEAALTGHQRGTQETWVGKAAPTMDPCSCKMKHTNTSQFKQILFVLKSFENKSSKKFRKHADHLIRQIK